MCIGSIAGGGKYQIKGHVARLTGFLFLAPIPAAILGAVVLMRVGGKRVEYESDTEAVSAKKAPAARTIAMLATLLWGTALACLLWVVFSDFSKIGR